MCQAMNQQAVNRANSLETRLPGTSFKQRLFATGFLPGFEGDPNFGTQVKEQAPPPVQRSAPSFSSSGLSIRRSSSPRGRSGGERKLATARRKGSKAFRR